ncbi:MAG: Asp-tRNA(Asn)/Glu-tRNA(Gln) amidotransferase GatCAB subunit A [Candidatus Omnitrophota bacterium]|nr:MAG: Asp-tRNA(Asn)/Glu-tRNA(Gln) amidotransferase GatCAB subunit A [Candidatus Omnitrophota bacterium]
MEIHKLSGWEISQKIKNKELTLNRVISLFKERIRRFNPQLNSLVSLFEDVEPPSSESSSELWGVPILIKDNICIKNREITCASKILKGFISCYDATVIEKIKKAGLVILGTTNMDEFAFGSSCENSCYGPTLNPYNKQYVPGGSSGGSAAGVSAGFSPLALGSDTGGSIRQPASFCGVVGFKPTYGRVSRYGLVAFGSSLDVIGPLARDIRDVAYLLEIISGWDAKDSTSSVQEKRPFSSALEDNIKGLKIGLPKEYFVAGLNKEVEKNVKEAIKVFESKGAYISEINLPHTEYAVPCYYILSSSEASSNLSRFDGIRYGARKKAKDLIEVYKKTRREGFGKEAKRRIMLGTFSLSSGYYEAYYLKALKVRSLIKKELQEVFRHYQAIITPTSPTPPFQIGERIEDPLSMYLSDIYTIPSNLSGIPSVSLPCGFTKEGLPVGLQIMANHFSEDILIRLSFSYQSVTNWHKIYPREYD